MAASAPVVIASDQSAVPISAASLPLPTGASTSALQTTANTSLSTIATNSGTQATAALQTAGNTSLSTISGQLPATLGAKTTANSMAVNIASDQTVPVSQTRADRFPLNKATLLPARTNGSSCKLTRRIPTTCALGRFRPAQLPGWYSPPGRTQA